MFSKQGLTLRYYLRASSPGLLLTQDHTSVFKHHLVSHLVILHRDNISCVNLCHENVTPWILNNKCGKRKLFSISSENLNILNNFNVFTWKCFFESYSFQTKYSLVLAQKFLVNYLGCSEFLHGDNHLKDAYMMGPILISTSDSIWH